jgi:hypothetical protein
MIAGNVSNLAIYSEKQARECHHCHPKSP